MKKLIRHSSLLALVLLFSAACTRQVSRVDPNTTIDLSGRWNDTDSRLVSEEMVQDCISRDWRTDFIQKHGRKPVVIVGLIQNKSHEHIPVETFIKDVERGYINTQTVRVVQNSLLREKIREERGDQQVFASQESQKKWGLELGADYMMFGTINSIVDQYGRDKVVSYQVNLELADIQTNEIVWIGDKKIKKVIKN